MDKRYYSVYMIGRSAVCPICSGMALLQEGRITCIDCSKRLNVKRAGRTDREIICTKAGRKEERGNHEVK